MAVISNCTCGCEPVCESGELGRRSWGVCCLNCGARSAIFPNRTEAVTSWNQIVTDNQNEVEHSPSGLLEQAIQHLRART